MKQAFSVYSDPEFKKEVIQILKKLRKIIARNRDHCNKELETIKRGQLKLDNSIAKMKTKLKTLNNKANKCKRTNKLFGGKNQNSREKDKRKANKKKMKAI